MASYSVHLAVSSMLGAAYGTAAVWLWDQDWGPVYLGAGLTALGGMLPDLDSDSGVPVRELFGLGAAATPFALYPRLRGSQFDPEQTLVLLGGTYLLIRYCIASVFKRWTVHRGMFHSIPGMLIPGLAVFLLYHSPDQTLRVFLAVGVMLGFLSHLVLDEIYSVDFMGLQVSLNKFAGSALKFYSDSWVATSITYGVLCALGFVAFITWE